MHILEDENSSIHAFGQDATQAGMPTAILQKVLGHESITTTMIYTDPDEEIVHQAHHQSFRFAYFLRDKENAVSYEDDRTAYCND